MHEYPITEQIIKIADKHCKEAGAPKVQKLTLVLGEYSGLVAESINMYFDVISEGTACEGAEIEIKRITAKLKCGSCGNLFERAPGSFACPQCGGDGGPTEIGKEFYIESIEVDA